MMSNKQGLIVTSLCKLLVLDVTFDDSFRSELLS